MNQKQNNKLNMYNNVQGVLSENQDVYQTYQPIVDAAGAFSGLVNQIRSFSSEQTIDYTGITDEKTNVKHEMALEAADLAKSGLSYAKATNNVLLAAYFDYTYSDIRYATNNKAVEITQVIFDEITKNIANLANYLVVQEDADNLGALLDRFKNLSETRSDKHSQGVATTKKISELFKQTDTLLEDSLDALVTRLRKKEPMFFDAYMNARQIIDLGMRHNKGEADAQL